MKTAPLSGLVVRGDGLGRRLGFPTANLKVSPRRRLRRGVFKVSVAGRALGGARLGACNVGVRPTLGGERRLHVEVNIPGFRGNLYGKRLTIRFLEKLRGEKKFRSLGALKEQIRRDVRAVLESERRNADAKDQ